MENEVQLAQEHKRGIALQKIWYTYNTEALLVMLSVRCLFLLPEAFLSPGRCYYGAVDPYTSPSFIESFTLKRPLRGCPVKLNLKKDEQKK